jgi:Sulfatase
MKRFIESASVALGVTTICLLWLVAPLVTSGHDTVYHWSNSASQLFVPAIVDFCILWVVLTPLFLVARRPGRLRVAVWCGMTLFLPWVALKNWAFLTVTPPTRWLSVSLFAAALMASLLLVGFWRPAFEPKFEGFVAFASMLLIFASISGLAILSELAWFGWQARSLNSQIPLHHLVAGQSTNAGRPRIIWIVFDELSYEQVYERRFRGLQLPAFDQLASQATVFTHAIPAGMQTGQVLPSLMTGEPADEVRSSADGQHLSMHNPDKKAWRKFDEHNSIFQDALNAGYSTAVAGWYNPYCRILPDVLNRCFWAFDALTSNGMLPTATTVQANIMGPLLYAAGSGLAYRFLSFFGQVPDVAARTSELHLSDYQALLNAADRVLDDPSASFVLLHLPVPHPGGIYNRATGKFALKHSSYIDNLALADKCLEHLRSKLEQSNDWDSSTIVIMGDHSWRTKLIWSSSPVWTEEDEIASQGGRFDDRPAYIVKLPQQRVGTRIETPFSALNTRKLLDALLTQNIRSAEDLSVWAQQAARQNDTASSLTPSKNW